jgi:flagellar M-ring protein FliF
MGVIRPALKALTRSTGSQRSGQLNAVVSEQTDRPQLAAPRKSNEPQLPTEGELALEDARKLTRDNPAAVAGIVKTWINGEAAA